MDKKHIAVLIIFAYFCGVIVGASWDTFQAHECKKAYDNLKVKYAEEHKPVIDTGIYIQWGRANDINKSTIS